MPKPTVVIGLLGTVLDRGSRNSRWERWRPTVSIGQHEDFEVSRFELLHGGASMPLAELIQSDFLQISPETDVRLRPTEFRDPWDIEDVYSALHDFARDYPFDTDHEEYLVHITTGTHVAQICWFLLTESKVIPAKLLQTSPPPRSQPDGSGEIRVFDLDLSKYDRIAQRFHREHVESVSLLKAGIDTRNSQFNSLIDEIEHVAAHSTDPILLTGPTGAGKSQLARRIYELRHQRRRLEGAFVTVNCATLRGDAAMSALFGHRRGAFTGALEDRAGLLREADDGLLFLDEIGELGADEQAMLLRAIEEKSFLPLGSDSESQSSFQLICGTHRDLKHDVQEGRFRADLLARINLWTFDLPSLADRPEDIEPNLDFELAELERHRKQPVRFSKEARDRYLSFSLSPAASWAANFRDLNASVRRMATFSPSGRITREVVDAEVDRLSRSWNDDRSDASVDSLRLVLTDEQIASIDLFDRIQLAAVLDVLRDSASLSDAGRKLFAASRQKRKSTNDADRLRKYLARFELSWQDVVD
ncbi:MAG: RNA repair transcriptional activator RtcR [Planctomycetota bacterium]